MKIARVIATGVLALLLVVHHVDATGIPYAIKFTNGAGGTWVKCSNVSAYDNLATGTILAWVYPTTFLPAGLRSVLRLDNIGFVHLEVGTTSGTRPLRITVGRATTAMAAEAAVNTLPTLLVNHHAIIAAQWDINGASTAQKVLSGDSSTPLAEPTSYATQTAGAGTLTSYAGADAYWGNSSGGSIGFPGLMYVGAIWNRVLSYPELLAWQLRPLARTVPLGLIGHVVFGANGTGGVIDLSRTAKPCVITSAVPTSDYLPIFGFRRPT